MSSCPESNCQGFPVKLGFDYGLGLSWLCSVFHKRCVFIKDVDVGTESLPNKLSDKAGLGETFDCVTDQMTFIGEHTKLEKWSEKYCIQF